MSYLSTTKVFIRYENESAKDYENRINKYLEENKLTNEQEQSYINYNQDATIVVVILEKVKSTYPKIGF